MHGFPAALPHRTTVIPSVPGAASFVRRDVAVPPTDTTKATGPEPSEDTAPSEYTEIPIWLLVGAAAVANVVSAVIRHRRFGAGPTVALLVAVAIGTHLVALARRRLADRRRAETSTARHGVYR
jgi:hypothetical protein